MRRPTPTTVATAVARLLPGALCLGVTASGEPRHPLYVRGDVPLAHYPRSVAEIAAAPAEPWG